MPKLMNQSASIVGNTVSNFGFSAKRPEELTATEYTLADIQVDVSSSVGPFGAQLTKALQAVRDSLTKSPRAENMLVRVSIFNHAVQEVHGFINLNDINPADYQLNPSGSTALYDASLASVEAVESEAARLDSLDFDVNAVVFIITDGEENASSTARTPQKIANAIERVRKAEKLESLKVILVGVGTPDANSPDDPDNATKQYLESFQQKAGLDQFCWIGSATPQRIAKLAQFVSKSISSSSQALGTGGPSQNLSF